MWSFMWGPCYACVLRLKLFALASGFGGRLWMINKVIVGNGDRRYRHQGWRARLGYFEGKGEVRMGE